MNLDAILKITAQVAGANEIKGLSENLQGVESSAKNASTGLQQAAQESSRAANESARSGAAARNQAVALQALRTGAQAGAAEMRRMGGETKALGADFQRIKGQSAGAFDGLSGSAVKGAASIRKLQDFLQPAEAQLAKLRESVLQYGAANTQSERSINLQLTALKNLRSQAEINGSTFNALSSDIQRLTAITKAADIESSNNANNLKRATAAGQAHAGSIQQQIQAQARFVESLQAGDGHLRQHATELARLQDRAVALGQAWEPGIRGLKLLSQASAENLGQQSRHMTLLQATLGEAGDAYRRVGREIDALRQKAASLDLSKGLNVTPGNVARGTVGAVQNIVAMRQDLARSMMGRVVLTGEGLAASGVAGAAGMGMASGLGGMAGGVQGLANSLDAIAAKAAAMPGVLKPLGGLLSEPAAAAANSVGQWSASLTAAQAKLAALSGPFEAIGNAISAIGPEASAAAGVASLAIAGVYQVLSRQADAAQADAEASFRGISDAAQKVLSDLVRIYDKVPNARLEAQQELRDLNMQRLGEVPSDSLEARRAANAVVSAEREINRIKGEQKALIESAQQAQNRSGDALRAQIQVARERLQTQQQLTAETKKTADADRAARQVAGSIRRNQERVARQVELERPQREAEAQALALLQSQKTVAQQRLEQQRKLTAEQQRTNEALRQEAAIRGSIRRNQERVAQEQARAARRDADLAARAAAAFPPSRVLALPAAGQSSFQGRVDAQGFGVGDGMRRLRGGSFEAAGTRDSIGPVMGSRSDVVLQQMRQSAQQAKTPLDALFVTIDKVTAASNGSVASLQRQRSAWEALRTAVNPAAPAYARATAQVQQLDEKLAKLTATQRRQQDVQRQGIGREAIGSALGTLASGGGAQGAIGALAGGLAFSGGPAGIVAGATVAAIGGAAALAGRVGVEAETAEVRLKALTTQFGEYNAAQASAARIASTLRISQIEAADGLSKLYAALRPTGISLQEVEDAYIGFNAAARASGATATESSAALLQLKQALGSGVLQGDELRSIREQAPAVAQAIAAEMGVTIGELKKLGSQGAITTDIVIRALAKLKDQKLGLLQEQFKTSSQVMKDLSVATEDFGRTVARVFGPVTVNIVKGLTEAVKRLNDASVAFRDPTAATAAGVIRSGRMPGTMASQTVLMEGARELFKGTSGPQGVGMTGLRKEAEALAKLRRQPVDGVLFELMRNRLERVDSQAAPGADQQQARSEAAAGRAAGRSRLAAAAAAKAQKAEEKAAKAAEKARKKAEVDARKPPAYIDKAVLRDWLRSQGFDRTSGDFTNRGHRTPNHMLNAMDMGVLTGPYDVAVQKTAAMKRRLAATGAFGNQLFGPGDPGHKDHLHVPTPGGRVKVTPGLAKLMGLGGAEGMAGDIAEWRNQADDRADQEKKTRADQLSSARELLATNQGLLKVAQATGPAAKLLAEFEAERAERARRYAELLKGVNGNPDAQAAYNAAQAAEAGRAEIQYREDLKRVTSEQLELDRQRLENVFAMGAAIKEFQTRDSVGAGLSQGMKQYSDSIGNLRDAVASLAVDGMGGLENSMVSLATTGSGNFNAFAASVLTDTSRMIFRQLVLKTIMQALGFLSPSAAAMPSMAQSFTGNFGLSTGFPSAPTFSPVGPTPSGLPGFAGGGYTGNGPRSGGLDGRGGFMAMLHPRETVVDHAQGNGGSGAASTTATVVINVHSSGTTSSESSGSGSARALGDDLARLVVPIVDQRMTEYQRPGGQLRRR